MHARIHYAYQLIRHSIAGPAELSIWRHRADSAVQPKGEKLLPKPQITTPSLSEKECCSVPYYPCIIVHRVPIVVRRWVVVALKVTIIHLVYLFYLLFSFSSCYIGYIVYICVLGRVINILHLLLQKNQEDLLYRQEVHNTSPILNSMLLSFQDVFIHIN